MMRIFIFALLILGVAPFGVQAKTYVVNDREQGQATWYGEDFEGKKTASGETFRKNGMTAAHRTLPFNSVVEVRNLKNGKTVKVRINDRGPFGGHHRIIDLSEAAAHKIGLGSQGTVSVEIRVLKIGSKRK